MSSRVRRHKRPFKACRKCKLLVPLEEERCPNCGSTDFTEEWEGMLIVIDPENSKLAQVLGITKPGKYAIRVR